MTDQNGPDYARLCQTMQMLDAASLSKFYSSIIPCIFVPIIFDQSLSKCSSTSTSVGGIQQIPHRKALKNILAGTPHPAPFSPRISASPMTRSHWGWEGARVPLCPPRGYATGPEDDSYPSGGMDCRLLLMDDYQNIQLNCNQ